MGGHGSPACAVSLTRTANASVAMSVSKLAWLQASGAPMSLASSFRECISLHSTTNRSTVQGQAALPGQATCGRKNAGCKGARGLGDTMPRLPTASGCAGRQRCSPAEGVDALQQGGEGGARGQQGCTARLGLQHRVHSCEGLPQVLPPPGLGGCSLLLVPFPCCITGQRLGH